MLAQSTLSYADLYGSTPPGFNPGDVNERDSADASGEYQYSGNAVKQPAYYWVGLVVLLAAIRFVWEWKGK